jgi:predicted nucleotidyltransferase
MRIADRHGASNVRIFGSVARGNAGPGSDLDVLVEMDRGLLAQAALQNDLEDLLGCPVHVTTTSGLRYAREDAREEIEREAVSL